MKKIQPNEEWNELWEQRVEWLTVFWWNWSDVSWTLCELLSFLSVFFNNFHHLPWCYWIWRNACALLPLSCLYYIWKRCLTRIWGIWCSNISDFFTSVPIIKKNAINCVCQLLEYIQVSYSHNTGFCYEYATLDVKVGAHLPAGTHTYWKTWVQKLTLKSCELWHIIHGEVQNKKKIYFMTNKVTPMQSPQGIRNSDLSEFCSLNCS